MTKDANTIIAYIIDKGLSQNSYSAVKNGKIKVPTEESLELSVQMFVDSSSITLPETILTYNIQTIQMDALSD